MAAQATITFSSKWKALAREAGIAAEHMAIGVTALGKANYAYPAYYGQAFFALSIGLERSAKLALLVDHAIRNSGIFPSESDIRKYSHHLMKLLDGADEVSKRLGVDRIPRTPVHVAIIQVLSDFASNVTRYYNLEVVTGAPSVATKKDPVAQWHDRIVKPLVEAHYKPHQRQKHERNARLVDSALGPHSLVHHIAESGEVLDKIYDASMKTAITEFIAPYVRLHVMQIIRSIAFLLSALGHEAQAQSMHDVPYMSEFFAIFTNDDKYLRGRKNWSIYHP